MRFLPRENRATVAEADAGFFELGMNFVAAVHVCCPMRKAAKPGSAAWRGDSSWR
jgi:hypothetical protein